MNFFNEQGYKVFDVTIFSCVVGIRKPERGIYQIALNGLSMQPKEAIFIDDKEENVKGAGEIGINTILFKSPEELKKELVTDFMDHSIMVPSSI